MIPEEANITTDYLKEMQEGYIEEKGYERHPLPEWYALDKAIEVIEQTTWIPCNKKLPKPQEDGDKDYSEWVQITLHIGENNDVVGRAFYCFSEKKWYTNGLGVGEVTAWMLLPEAYKENK